MILLVLLALHWGLSANADEICSYYRQHKPRLYEIVCQGGQSRSRAGASYSSFSDAFNLNSASIPTEESPYGLETIGSFSRKDDSDRYYSFALVKGFHKIGTAVSTASNMSFYGNDIKQRLYGSTSNADLSSSETAQGHITNLNLGTSIALNSTGSGEGGAPAIGLSVRYNKITNTLGWGAGITASADPFVFGLGVSREKVSNLLPEILFYSAVVGLKIPYIEFEYTYLKNEGGGELDPIHIFTATGVLGPFLISGAMRKLNYRQLGDVTQFHWGAQLQLSSNIAVGYLYNYLPGANSLALQLFL
jgi:hypothetical protein